MSHENTDGDWAEPDGYFCANDRFDSLKNGEIPEFAKVNSPGTLVAIPGFSAGSSGDYASWQEQAFNSISGSFWYALLKEKLQVTIDSSPLDKMVLLQTKPSLHKIVSEDILRYIQVAQSDPVKHYIKGIGDVSLHIKVGGEKRRALALVRSPGLMITDRAKSLNEANPSIPVHWNPFTAAVFVEPRKGDTLLRDGENPAHDQISVSQVKESDRGAASKAYKELSQYLYAEIKKVCDPGSTSSENTASELEAFDLVIEDPDNPTSKKVSVTQPKPLPKSPKISSVRSHQTLQTDTLDDEDGNEQVAGNGGSGGRGSGKTQPSNLKPQQRSRIETDTCFVPVVDKNGSLSSHRMAVTVNTMTMIAEDSDIRLEVCSIGEDERLQRMGIMEAKLGNQNLDTDANSIFLPKSEIRGERLRIDLRLNEAVDDKTFTLICHREEEEETRK